MNHGSMPPVAQKHLFLFHVMFNGEQSEAVVFPSEPKRRPGSSKNGIKLPKPDSSAVGLQDYATMSA